LIFFVVLFWWQWNRVGDDNLGKVALRNKLGGLAGKHGVDGAAKHFLHDEKLHQIVVDRSARGLDYKYIALADVFMNADEGVVVGKLEYFSLAYRDIQVLANGCGKFRVGIASEYFELVDS
jgi:hypothetical protein